MTTPKRENRGRFRPGHDSRRHRFTRDECVKGFWAALDSIITRYPTAVDSNGRHMAFGFLAIAGRQSINTSTNKESPCGGAA